MLGGVRGVGGKSGVVGNRGVGGKRWLYISAGLNQLVVNWSLPRGSRGTGYLGKKGF